MSILVLALLYAGIGADAPDPLAPVRAGMVLCRRPNDAKKVCGEIDAYRLLPGGAVVEDSTLLMSGPNDYYLIKITAPVTVKGNAICGAWRRDDVAKGRIVSPSGKPIDDEQAQIGSLIIALEDLLDKQMCTSFKPDTDGLVVGTTTTEGEDKPNIEKARWVRPGDGYQVAPESMPSAMTT